MPSANEEPKGEAPPRLCPSCGKALPPGEARCPACGAGAAQEDVLKEVEDLLDGLLEPGDIGAPHAAVPDVEPAAPSPPAGGAPSTREMKSVDDLLDRISDPDALFAEAPAEAEAPPPAGPPSAPPGAKAPPGPPGKKKAGKPISRQAIDEALSKANKVDKVHRITVVERRRKHSRIFRRTKIKCLNCNEVFDPTKLSGSVDKCLNCGSKLLKWVDEAAPAAPVTEIAPAEETEAQDEGGGEAAAEAAEAAEAPAEEAPPAGIEERAPAPAPEAPREPGDLVKKRLGQKDYYAAYREPQNLYGEQDAGRREEPPAADASGPEAPAAAEGEKGGGWGEALKGELAIKKRSQDEAALRDDFFIGKKIGSYKVLGLIGRGAMGTVFKAEAEDGKAVALKILPPIFSGDEAKVARFEKESASASRLEHENIVRYFDYGKEGDVHYLAMELVEGKSVGDLIKGKRAVKIEEALRIVKYAATGLAHAHEQGIIHRDIKPDNIMINKENVVQVADFGLARDLAASQSFGSGEIVGTPYYISPEQIDCLDVDGRADIYSLGATIYHLITGKRPFEGETPMEVLLKHVNERLTPPVDLNPLVPRPVSRLMQKMLEKNRDFRYQNCRELVADIEAIENGGTPQIVLEEETTPKKKAPAPVVPRARNEVLIAFAWVVVILLAAVGVRFAALPPLDPEPVFSREIAMREEAARALQEALAFQKANPDSPAEAVKAFGGVAAKYPNFPEGRQAAGAGKKIAETLQKEARSWAEERARAAASLEAAGEPGRALFEALAAPPARLQGLAELDVLKSLQARLATVLAERDGMALVPGGLAPERALGPGKPAVQVAPFLVDLAEVSNREYLEFVKAAGARGPWPEGAIPEGMEDYPVTGVTWAEAEAYAKFRGKRLPTETEWELAAAGEEGRPYPWGRDFDPARAKYRESGSEGPDPVRSRPEGRTPLGLFHVAGNVWEWASPPEGAEGTFKVARGGGWASHPALLRTSSRLPLDPATRDPSLGFRCVRKP